MAVFRFLRKCEVCEKITLIRVQAGHLPEYPVRINCGNCQILFSGKVLFDEEHASTQLLLYNCNNVNSEEEVSFSIEVSGELPTMKLHNATEVNKAEFMISPFIRFLSLTGDKKYEDFQRLVLFLRTLKEGWPRYRRIYELYLKQNWDLLNRELYKIVKNKSIKLEFEIDYIMGVHQLLVHFLSTPLSPTGFFNEAQQIKQEISRFDREAFVEIRKLIDYIDQIGFIRLEDKIFRCVEAFVEKFQYIMPGYALYFYDQLPEHSRLGATTATFEDLKGFYIDTYEIMMDNIGILVGLNNLKHRGSFQAMKEKRRDVSTIDAFDKLQNGKKIEFINGDETFDQLILNKFDHKLRNAIGHASTHYDGINQLITYYPKGNESEDDTKTIYLIDFMKNCIEQFYALMNLGELLYHLKKIKCIQYGQVPSGVNIFEELGEEITSNGKNKKRINKGKAIRTQQKKSRKANRK